MCVPASALTQQEADRKLSEAVGGWASTAAANEREWARRLADVELNWEKRLRDGWVADGQDGRCLRCVCAMLPACDSAVAGAGADPW
jgi:hypothetical protein